MKKIVLLIAIAFIANGCGYLAEKHYESTQQYKEVVHFESEIGKEFYDRWDFYSGMLDVIQELYPNSVPPVVTTLKDKLDAIEKMEGVEFTLRQKGQIRIMRAFLMSEAFRQMIDSLMPLAKFAF